MKIRFARCYVGITFGGIVATPRCYGQGNGPIWLDNLRCASNEGNLFGCPNNGIMNHDCLHYEDAGVQCSCELKSHNNTRILQT